MLDRLGLGYAAVSAINPAIVYASITSQGETGPFRHHRTYGSTLDAMGGLSSLMGYADGAPEISGGDLNYPDQVVSVLATGTIMAALRKARASGHGVHLDISQRETVSFLLGEEILVASENRRPARPRGNGEEGVSLQGCFLSRDGTWIAVTARDAGDDKLLASLVGASADPLQQLADWIAERDARAAVDELRAHGLAAAPSNNGHDLLADQRLLGDAIVWADEGTMLKGMPYRFEGQPFVVRQRAPRLGEHTHEILASLLHMPQSRIDELEAAGILSDRPTATP